MLDTRQNACSASLCVGSRLNNRLKGGVVEKEEGGGSPFSLPPVSSGLLTLSSQIKSCLS